jgi:hypothetical protein
MFRTWDVLYMGHFVSGTSRKLGRFMLGAFLAWMFYIRNILSSSIYNVSQLERFGLETFVRK